MKDKNEVLAITRNVRMSAQKGRPLARACQGKSALEALKVVEFSPRKAARIIKQTIKSAIANATHNNGWDADKLFVKMCVFDEGTRMRRFWPRARGSASPIAKRLCHCKIVLVQMGE